MDGNGEENDTHTPNSKRPKGLNQSLSRWGGVRPLRPKKESPLTYNNLGYSVLLIIVGTNDYKSDKHKNLLYPTTYEKLNQNESGSLWFTYLQ